jgi:hypothetical protein
MVTLTWSDDAGAVIRETAALTARPFGGNLVLTGDHHRRLGQALEAGLRIVSSMLGDPAGYIGPVRAGDADPPRRSPRPRSRPRSRLRPRSRPRSWRPSAFADVVTRWSWASLSREPCHMPSITPGPSRPRRTPAA